MRTIAVASVCLTIVIWNWHYIAAPAHRPFALLALAAMFSGAIFYELTVRDAPMEWVLSGLLGVLLLAGSAWIGLQVFTNPLPNDHAPLAPARNSRVAGSCPIPRGGLQVILANTSVLGPGAGPVTPFRIGACSGPVLTRLGQGLLVNAFGYDDDGTLIYRIRNNQFELLQGEYLHLHRTDRSTLALYDKSESEVLYLRYLAPDTVRIRGRFLCSGTSPVTIGQNELAVASGPLSLPSCITLKAGGTPNLALKTY